MEVTSNAAIHYHHSSWDVQRPEALWKPQICTEEMLPQRKKLQVKDASEL